MLNVFATGEQEKAALEKAATRSATTLSRTPTRAPRPAWSRPQQVKDEEALAADLAEHGLKKGAQFQGKSIVPTPGDTVIQRAVIFTDAVGSNLSPHDVALPLRRGARQVDHPVTGSTAR